MHSGRDFRIFLTAQTLSALGDAFSFVAIPLLVLRATGSLVQMGAVTALVGASSILTGLFAGYLADRVDRRALLITCDIARCLLYGLIPLVWLFSPQVWLLYAIMPLTGAFAMQFQVTYVTVVPGLVKEDQITKANGHLYSAYSVAGVAGPLLAGLVSALVGPAMAIAVDATSFALSAAGIALIKFRATPQTPPHQTPLKDFLAGAEFLWRHPALRALTALLSLLIFITYGLTDLIIYYLKHDLGHSDRTVGYVLAAATLGSLLAATTVASARRHLGFAACWIGSWALCGTAIAFLGLSPGVLLVGALAVVQLFATGTAGICSMSFRQEVTPDHLLGRVTASFWTIHNTLGPLGVAALTGAASRYGIKTACLTAGTLCTLTALTALKTPIRTPN
ncbi:MFS transporter [Actinomadura litoris]|uniref:MFS transporter n=1 Tax=Actinomadura litoris TaxID=2678616 RepID=A0A7K1L1K6_9ACTN|nr:MFS transporter [Actinomadura litoris]MUN38334.1 MFS transporter [Actinomadura litoris]